MLWSLILLCLLLQQVLKLTASQKAAICAARQRHLMQLAAIWKRRQALLQQLHVAARPHTGANKEAAQQYLSADDILQQIQACDLDESDIFMSFHRTLGGKVLLLLHSTACAMLVDLGVTLTNVMYEYIGTTHHQFEHQNKTQDAVMPSRCTALVIESVVCLVADMHIVADGCLQCASVPLHSRLGSYGTCNSSRSRGALCRHHTCYL